MVIFFIPYEIKKKIEKKLNKHKINKNSGEPFPLRPSSSNRNNDLLSLSNNNKKNKENKRIKINSYLLLCTKYK